jgi:hypothetical protein
MTESDVVTRRAPLWPSVLAAVWALAAVVLAGLATDTTDPDSFRLAIVGYTLGGVLTPLAVSAHRYLRDEARRSTRYFDPRYAYDRMAVAAMVVGLLAAVWHAFVVATELAR